MDSRIYLHIPQIEELWYRRMILRDPATMDYNRGYALDFDGYDAQTGCIDFPQEQWARWHACFIGKEPKRYYAYIARADTGEFIGEVNIRQSETDPWHEMGIVIEARHRGRGYAADALRLLLRQAFEVCHAEAVHNAFEDTRGAAARAHLSAGFRVCQHERGMLELIITKDQYGGI